MPLNMLRAKLDKNNKENWAPVNDAHFIRKYPDGLDGCPPMPALLEDQDHFSGLYRSCAGVASAAWPREVSVYIAATAAGRRLRRRPSPPLAAAAARRRRPPLAPPVPPPPAGWPAAGAVSLVRCFSRASCPFSFFGPAPLLLSARR